LHPDVVVVGGGCIGLATAWRCAQSGMRVSLVDPAAGEAASFVAAGLLAPVTEAHPGEEPLLALNLEAARHYESFVDELEALSGFPSGYRRSGTIVAARDRDDLEALEELYRFQVRLGLEVERLRSRELRELEPGLSPRVMGGLFVAGDHQVDPAALTKALVEACDRSGVERIEDRVVSVEAGPVLGLGSGGSLVAGSCVIAAGAWSGSIEGAPASLRRIRPVKGQLLQLRTLSREPAADHNVRGLDVYLLPRTDGRLVVGASMEERGFDRTITAGATHDLLRRAFELLPDVVEHELVQVAAGLRPTTPDNAPLIGWTDELGVLAACGHFRNGVLLADITARTIAETLVTGTAPDAIADFSPGRFSGVVS
jgi:glycine oxidase